MSLADPHNVQPTFEISDHDDSLPGDQRIIKRTIRLTPEGWVFLVILAFVAFGAILRNVNLLIILAGMMVSAITLNWRSAKLRLKTITGQRELPTRVYAGKLFSIVWKIRNASQQRIWSINIEDHVDSSAAAESQANRVSYLKRLRRKISDKINQHRRVGPNEVRLNVPQVSPDNYESSVYQCLLNQRGKYTVGPATISTTFPLGLIEIELEVDNAQTLYAAPAIGTLVPEWEKRAAATATGSESVKRKRGSTDDEFFALRKWRSGDSRRNIHWRTTAKMQQPMVRQFDEPTNRDLAIVVDLFESNENPTEVGETILSFASTIAAQTKNAFDGQISIAICGKQNDVFRNLNRRKYNANLIRCLAMASNGSDPDLYSAITLVGQSVSPGTPIFIVSTRTQPFWITHMEAAPSSRYRPSDQNELFQSLAYPNTQLGRLNEQIRWLDANTAEFKALFTSASATDQTRIDHLEQRWT